LETHYNACTTTTSPPTSSAHSATCKDACWELQHKRLLWSEPKTTAVLVKHAANLCRKATPQVIKTQILFMFFALGTVPACSTHSLYGHRRSQNLMCARVLPCLRATYPYLRVTILRVGLTLACLCLAYAASVLFARVCHVIISGARVLLYSLYLLCTSCPLFLVVVITVCAEIISLYPTPFLSFPFAQPSLSAHDQAHTLVEGSSPPRLSCVYPRAYVCVREYHVSVCVQACVYVRVCLGVFACVCTCASLCESVCV